MRQEKDNYKVAMSELRESIKPEHIPFLDQIDRYTGELRRQAGTLRSRIDELQGTVDSQRGKINDLARFQDKVASLEKQLASGKKEREQLAGEIQEVRQLMPEWQEIDDAKSAFVKVKAKCMNCGLHFVLCTVEPERHGAATIHCPECGQHRGYFMVWQEVPKEILICQLVPGHDQLVGVKLPKQAS